MTESAAQEAAGAPEAMEVDYGFRAFVVDGRDLKPPRGWVVVRAEHLPAVREGLFRPVNRSTPTHYGTVVRVGAGVVEVEPGDRVIVESCSGHPAMTRPIVDSETGALLEIVPCRKPDPVQLDDEAYMARQIRLKALIKVFGGPNGKRKRKRWPPRAALEASFLEWELDAMKKARRGKSRSRLWPIMRDPARGQGVLAVVEED